jgi:hypothetical protein
MRFLFGLLAFVGALVLFSHYMPGWIAFGLAIYLALVFFHASPRVDRPTAKGNRTP